MIWGMKMDGDLHCAIPGCRRPALGLPDGANGFCDEHVAMAPDAHRRRFLSVVRRLRFLREIWSDEGRYANIVANDRYLKLAHATCCAEEALDAAAQRLTLSILAAQASMASIARAEQRRSA
jgi:hypothetical protein